MTIRKTDVVDWLGLEKGTGRVVLAVIDDEDWTNEHEHLHLLENKLNTYLAFIESGQVYERLAEDLGREVGRGHLKMGRCFAAMQHREERPH